MVVAKAAPLACILGAPNKPNMNTAFKQILITTAPELMRAPGFTWSVTFMMVR